MGFLLSSHFSLYFSLVSIDPKSTKDSKIRKVVCPWCVKSNPLLWNIPHHRASTHNKALHESYGEPKHLWITRCKGGGFLHLLLKVLLL
jgi:hypothetical protein